jgi:hypothetical protein
MELDWSQIVNLENDDVLRDYGARYRSVKIQAAIEDLKPLAVAHHAVIPGYDARMLAELSYVGDLIDRQIKARELQRKSGKEGALLNEKEKITTYKWVLRQARTALKNAINTRSLAEGETRESAKEARNEMLKALATLGGNIGNDALGLRNRLVHALELVQDPRLNARVRELQGEKDLAAQLTAGVAALPEVRGEKVVQKRQALTDTADQDLLDGLAYLNLKALVESGRTYFRSQRDNTRAALFNLDKLNEPTLTGSAGEPSAPETPSPSTPS